MPMPADYEMKRVHDECELFYKGLEDNTCDFCEGYKPYDKFPPDREIILDQAMMILFGLTKEHMKKGETLWFCFEIFSHRDTSNNGNNGGLKNPYYIAVEILTNFYAFNLYWGDHMYISLRNFESSILWVLMYHQSVMGVMIFHWCLLLPLGWKTLFL